MLNMMVGPTRISPGVLEALAQPPPPIDDPGFVRLFQACMAGLRPVVGSEGGQAFIVPGTGTMGMEMVAASFVPAESPVAVLSTGYWGDRWATIAERVGLRVFRLGCPPGETLPPPVVAALLRRERCCAVFLTHVDSSTGVRTDLPAIAAVARERGALVLVDGICAAGAEEARQAEWGVDVYLTSTPKGLGVPAGLVLVTAGERATTALRNRPERRGGFALDLREWLAPMAAAECGVFEYFQSPAGNLVLALAEGLRLLHAEPLRARLRRHAELTGVLHAGLEDLGIEVLARDGRVRAHGVTVCLYPDGHGREMLEAVRAEGVRLPAGVDPRVAERTFRIGHLGNVTAEDVVETLAALERVVGRRPRAATPRLVASGAREAGRRGDGGECHNLVPSCPELRL